jgi:flagellar protein FlaG
MDVRLNGTAMPTAPRTADRPQPLITPQSSVQPGGAVLDGSQAVQRPDPAAPASQLDDALHNINKSMQSLSQEIQFSIDPDTDRTIVKVVDQRTQEVIRQMPSTEALEIAKALDRLQGLLIRQQA